MPDQAKKSGDGEVVEVAGAKPAEPVQSDSPEKYFLVIVNDGSEDAPTVQEHDTLEAFANAVNENVLAATNTLYAFGFKGQRVRISAPTPICAVEINGKRAEVGSEDRSFDDSGRIIPLRKGVS